MEKERFSVLIPKKWLIAPKKRTTFPPQTCLFKTHHGVRSIVLSGSFGGFAAQTKIKINPNEGLSVRPKLPKINFWWTKMWKKTLEKTKKNKELRHQELRRSPGAFHAVRIDEGVLRGVPRPRFPGFRCGPQGGGGGRFWGFGGLGFRAIQRFCFWPCSSMVFIGSLMADEIFAPGLDKVEVVVPNITSLGLSGWCSCWYK